MDYQQNSYYGQFPQQEKKGLAITSLVFGIISIVACGVFAGVLAIPGLILGIMALVKKQAKGMALAGLITSIIGIVLFVLITGFWVFWICYMRVTV